MDLWTPVLINEEGSTTSSTTKLLDRSRLDQVSFFFCLPSRNKSWYQFVLSACTSWSHFISPVFLQTVEGSSKKVKFLLSDEFIKKHWGFDHKTFDRTSLEKASLRLKHQPFLINISLQRWKLYTGIVSILLKFDLLGDVIPCTTKRDKANGLRVAFN